VALLLMGLVVLPLSAEAQVAGGPAKQIEAKADLPTTPSPQPSVIATSAAPAAEPAVAIQAVDPARPIEATPPQLVATSAATSQSAGEKSMEERLQRLERLVESLVSDRSSRPAPSTTQYLSRRAPLGEQVTAYGLAGRQAAPSLADLKKQRIDIEDELDKLQERLKNIDDQIAKLQSARPRSAAEKQ
jgi:hypothetical protein